ncbi:MAG: Mur ligase family protein [bacterium]
MKIHLIGIGGIGVSALAQYYLKKKNSVTGSDLAFSEIISLLEKKGAQISIGKQQTKNLPDDADLVIYSPAVREDNPELKEAVKRGIKCQSYPQALGDLTKTHFTIAVAGTHGKSTTTSLIAIILIKAGLNPTVIVGTKLKEFKNSNFRMGGNILVIEACEHEASFLNYYPQIIVLTNIEADHLDYYKNLDNILKAFKEFVSHLPDKGILITNKDDKNSTLLKKGIGYSLRQAEALKLKKILKVPGEHNIYNALAALAAARVLKVKDQDSFAALAKFKGSWRRFEIFSRSLNNKRYTLVNDYAHHPTEIKATLTAAREKFPQAKISCFFQPHQYQRTFYLFPDFVKTFQEALDKDQINKLAIIDIYDVAGREDKEIKKKVSSQKMVEAIRSKKTVLRLSGIKEAKEYLEKTLTDKEVVIIMGAGDIYQLAGCLST